MGWQVTYSGREGQMARRFNAPRQKVASVVQPPAPKPGALTAVGIMGAMEGDDTAMLDKWLRDPSTHLEDTSDDQSKCQTAVIWCARKGAVRCLQMLVDSGASVNAQMVGVGATALYLATQEGQEQCVRILLAGGADANIARDTGTTPLAVAAKQNFYQIVFLLVQAGVKLDAASTTGATPLFVAAKAGNAESLVQLIRAGGDVNHRAIDGSTPLMAAAMSNNPKCIDALLEANAEVSAQLPEGSSAIFVVCRIGNADVLRKMIAAGADVNARCRDGSTALIVAAQKAHHECMQALLRAGANVDAALQIGATALYVASQEGHHECVQLLLDAGACANTARSTGASPLFAACQQGHETCAQKLLTAGANPSCATDTGTAVTALSVAVQQAHLGCVRMLLDGGAQPHMGMRDGTTALFAAAEKGCKPALELLLGRSITMREINPLRQDGVSALDIAEQNAHAECAQLLASALQASGLPLKRPADAKPRPRLTEALIEAISQDDDDALGKYLDRSKSHADDYEQSKGQTALILAARSGSGKCMQLCIDRGANPNVRMAMNATALYIATQQGFKGCMRLLLQAGANPNIARDGGVAPLYIAAQKNRQDCVELLLASGANINSAKADLTAVTHCVTQAGLADCLLLLLRAGAHVDIATADGTTAVHIAAQSEDTACLQTLLDRNASCNMLTAQGFSPLYLAAKAGRPAAIRALLAAKAHAMYARPNGSTPLMAAVQGGFVECAELILAEGVDPNAVTSVGVSALMVATQREQHDCMLLLLENGAQSGIASAGAQTPLAAAVERDDEKASGILTRAGANVNLANDKGVTPLLAAVRRGNGGIVKLLLGAGADVNAGGTSNGSALIIAVSEGRKDLLRMLLAAGCSDALYCPSLDSPLAGRTALDFALDAKDGQSKADTVQLLRDAGAVAPCFEPRGLIGARVIVDEREGTVMSCDDKAAFGMSAADRNIKYTIEFDDASAEGGNASESVKLIRSGGEVSNAGALYTIVGQLRGTGVSGKVIDAMATKPSAAAVASAPSTTSTPSPAPSSAAGALAAAAKDDTAVAGAPRAPAQETKEEAGMRESLTAFYQVHNPEMLGDLEQMQKVVRYYATRQDELNAALSRQYGYDLTTPRPTAIGTAGDGPNREAETQSVSQAVAKGHGTALTNLLQNGAKLPLALRTDARAVLDLAEESELSDVQEKRAAWATKASEASAAAEASAKAAAIQRAKATECSALEEAAARSATAAQLAAPAIKDSNAEVAAAQTAVAKLAGQLHGHKEDIEDLKAEIARLQQQLQDTEDAVKRLSTEHDVSAHCLHDQPLRPFLPLHHVLTSPISTFRCSQGASKSLQQAQSRAVEVEGKNDTAIRETEKHESALEARAAADASVERALAEDGAAQSALEACKSGLGDAECAEKQTMAVVAKVRECAERLSAMPGDEGCLEAAVAVQLLLEMPSSFRIQRLGLALLIAMAREPEHAHAINAANGQQAILFNAFRELLSDDIETLRSLLAASRLQTIDTVSKAIRAATEIKSAPALVAALCEPSLAAEPIVQLRGVSAILDLFENHDTALYQLQTEADVRRQLGGLLGRLQEECPMELELCAAAVRLAALLAVFERINDAMELSGVCAALESVDGGAPPAFRCFAAKKCLHDVTLVTSVTTAAALSNMLRLLPLTLADTAVSAHHAQARAPRHQLLTVVARLFPTLADVQHGGPVKRVHGILEIAEWLSQTDEDVGGDGYLASHLENLLSHDVTSLARAKEQIEDYGDLREWQIPKEAAKALFGSLQARLLERL